MKITLRNVPLKALALTSMLLTAGTASAVTLGVAIDDPYMLGTVIHGVQAGGQAARDVTMTTNLLTVALGDTQPFTTVNGGNSSTDDYHRSLNVFSALPAPTATGAVIATGAGLALNGNYVQLTLAGSFTYLVAAWDGDNGGVAIYDIAGLAAGTQISLLRYAQPVNGALVDGANPLGGGQYGMTGWTLLNPRNNEGDSVPDSGSVLILAGMAMVALGIGRRFI